jgi:protein TonB
LAKWRHNAILDGFCREKTMSRNLFQVRQLALSAAAALVLISGSTSTARADSPPKIDHSYPTPQPAYPDSAQLNGDQGDVLVGVKVSASGKPRMLRIDRSSGSGVLDSAAAEAVAQWRFIPAIENGDTTSAWTTIKIHFELPQPAQPVYVTPPNTKP